MSTLREENLEVITKKLAALEEVIGGGFNSPYDFWWNCTQEEMKEELEDIFEDDTESIEFLSKDNVYLVGQEDTSGSYLFLDTDKENSPVYMYEDGDVSEVFELESYREVAKKVFEIDKSDLTDEEKYTQIESIAYELLDMATADMICWKLRRCFEF